MNHIPSPDNSDSGIERQIQAKGKTGPRVTPDALAAVIESEHFFTGAEAVRILPQNSPLFQLTICILVLKNGFTVVGESACAYPENFDAEIGRGIARQNAKNKIWPLLGYELKTKLASA